MYHASFSRERQDWSGLTARPVASHRSCQRGGCAAAVRQPYVLRLLDRGQIGSGQAALVCGQAALVRGDGSGQIGSGQAALVCGQPAFVRGESCLVRVPAWWAAKGRPSVSSTVVVVYSVAPHPERCRHQGRRRHSLHLSHQLAGLPGHHEAATLRLRPRDLTARRGKGTGSIPACHQLVKRDVRRNRWPCTNNPHWRNVR